jgi:hypothetical protein
MNLRGSPYNAIAPGYREETANLRFGLIERAYQAGGALASGLGVPL